MKPAALHLLLLPFVSLAYAESDVDLFDLSLDQLSQIRVSSATYTERSLLDIPASITIFTGEQIHNMGILTLEELANYVPGFQSQRSGVKAHIRPISARSYRKNDAGNEILVLLNGARLNDGNGGGVFSMISELPVSNAARVEFMRGPGSAIYGGNAMTAVINIVTREEGNDFSLGSGSEARESMLLNYYSAGNSLHFEQYRDKGQVYRGLPDNNNTRFDEFRDPNERRHLFISRKRDNYFLQLYAGRNEFKTFGPMNYLPITTPPPRYKPLCSMVVLICMKMKVLKASYPCVIFTANRMYMARVPLREHSAPSVILPVMSLISAAPGLPVTTVKSA